MLTFLTGSGEDASGCIGGSFSTGSRRTYRAHERGRNRRGGDRNVPSTKRVSVTLTLSVTVTVLSVTVTLKVKVGMKDNGNVIVTVIVTEIVTVTVGVKPSSAVLYCTVLYTISGPYCAVLYFSEL